VTQQREDSVPIEPLARTGYLHCLQVECASKHSQPLEEQLLRPRQRLVAPIQRGLQRLMAVGGRPPATDQHQKRLCRRLAICATDRAFT
jgi:hypothetical protein